MHCFRTAARTARGKTGVIAFALTAGVLLMTFAIPPIDALAADASPVLADFSTNEGNPGWYVVNDNVMGGRSEGGFTIADAELRFAGRTNTDGGGFSSIRTRPVEFDLSAFPTSARIVSGR